MFLCCYVFVVFLLREGLLESNEVILHPGEGAAGQNTAVLTMVSRVTAGSDF